MTPIESTSSLIEGSSARSEAFAIEETLPRERLDAFLHARYAALSRGTIQRLIESGDIQVNGRNAKASHRPKAGDQVQIHWPEPKPAQALPEEMPLQILYEDEDLVVINKPPGLVIHPAAGHAEHTLVNALLHHCAGQLSGIGGVARPGIVHRLDKDTSGCLVAAKNDATHMSLTEQFQQRSIEKVYHAILCGELPPASGDIREAIGRHPIQRKRMAVVPNGQGREAWTSYRVLERLKGATLVEVLLHTGRTHQIRVHFLHVGFPIAGDDVYGKRPNQRLGELTNYSPPRQMLHAFALTFQHPRSGEQRRFEAPWPQDFQKARQALSLPTRKATAPGP
jgi:23S rRNA pseudouridine1911/1915/1917 synthase